MAYSQQLRNDYPSSNANFWLPQAIWAIPNILDSNTTRSFIGTSIVVGVATYTVVLNLDTLASKVRKHYDAQKRKVIQQMQTEPQLDWRKLGERFEEFKPLMEKRVPSEWWICIFIIRRLPWYVLEVWRKIMSSLYRMRFKAKAVLDAEEHDRASPSTSSTSQNSQFPLISGGNGTEGAKKVKASTAHLPGMISLIFKDGFRIQNPWKQGRKNAEELELSSV